jgi:hypothetical protein
LFSQFVQPQLLSHLLPYAKQSQYLDEHLDFLQLHLPFFLLFFLFSDEILISESFLQFKHLQLSPHTAPFLKHLQYYFMQWVLLQLHPVSVASASSFGSKIYFDAS